MTHIKLSTYEHFSKLKANSENIEEAYFFDYFSDSFVQSHTKHKNFIEFCQAINCDTTSQENLDALQNGEFDNSIQMHSEFESWEAMAETAYYESTKE